ncbi:phage antirepressor KilAC domain-containing protein [Acholeplasma laidlawii]|uniref:phage antirepressor KilAC domain-containing protein n=1 Tax=Acholeplasma laidlawii TaxID=2148 RepID=UPI00254019F4|nr:phage antirepressor KilAC domain-containing protein [Acholeplasma laidlawii]
MRLLYLKVIPTLRTYIDYDINRFNNPDVLVQFLDQYEDLKIKSNIMQTTLKVNEPKTKMVDALMEIKNCYDLSNVHEMLKFRGTRNTQLLKILRSYNILDKENMPRTEYIDKRYFRVVEAKASHETKMITVKRVYVYQSGINFIEKLMRQYEGERYAKTK